ncbi:MAG: SUMF1/EgtB/PvdO family nonheme iron enzyme [Symploca sp. SIO2E6]|nr:SUMF1/EgtB/PvdO family nonheme iron enzyme [Symploca sp. SIO2E6]
MTNLVRIKENVEIDLSYITCAEYQLFIDEMREVGKNRQPDYWQDYRFPPGDVRKPITGVRVSDAEEFCAWLTQQQSILGFRYRLPTLAEVEENPATEKHIGCWCNGGEIVGIEASWWQDWYGKLAEVTILNRDFDRVLYRDFDRDLNLDIDLYRVLYKKIEANKASDFLILYFPLLFLIVIYQMLLVIYQATSQDRDAPKQINLISCPVEYLHFGCNKAGGRRLRGRRKERRLQGIREL